MAAVITQRTCMNARLIVVLFRNGQHAFTGVFRYTKLFTASVQDQAGGGF
jgi:hypothetical protein